MNILDEYVTPLGASVRRAISESNDLAQKVDDPELSSDIGKVNEAFLLGRLNAYKFL
jgi:hypothetical protein